MNPKKVTNLEGFNLNARPGAADIRGQQASMFPFDAFDFDREARTDGIRRLHLKQGWAWLFGDVPEEDVTDTTPPSGSSGITSLTFDTRARVIVEYDAFTDDESGLAYYYVYRSSDAGHSDAVVLGFRSANDADPLTFVDEISVAGETYYYGVAAVDKRGNLSSTLWYVSSVTPEYGVEPATPVLVGSVGRRGVSISWQKDDVALDLVGYRVGISRDNSNFYEVNAAADDDGDDWKTGSANDWASFVTRGGTNYVVPYLPIPLDSLNLPQASGQTYYFKVRAYTERGTYTESASIGLLVKPQLSGDIAARQLASAMLDAANFVKARNPNAATEALVAWYPFEDSSDVGHDASGGGFNGTPTGSPTLSDGISGQGLLLASGKYVSLPSSVTNLTGTFSIGFWLKSSTSYSGASSFGTIVQRKASGNDNTRFEVAVGNYSGLSEKLHVQATNGSGTVIFDAYLTGGYNALADGNWHFVLLVFDAANNRVYVDGVAVSWTFVTGGLTTSVVFGGTNESTIGRRIAGTNTFAGNLDELRIFSRALNADEAMYYYLNPAGAVPAMLVADRIVAGAVTTSKLAAGAVVASKITADNYLFGTSVSNGDPSGTFSTGFLRILMGIDSLDSTDNVVNEFAIKRQIRALVWRKMLKAAQRSGDSNMVDIFLNGIIESGGVYSRFGVNRSKRYTTNASAGLVGSSASSETGVTFIVCANEKVFKSTDGGKTWSSVTVPFTGTAVLTGVVWMGGTNWLIFAGSGSSVTCSYSSDDGANWGAENSVGTSGAGGPVKRGFAYTGNAVVIVKDGSIAQSKVVRRSTDNGATWTDVTVFTSGGATAGIFTLAFDPATGWGIAWQTGATRVAITTDGGANWTEQTAGLPSGAGGTLVLGDNRIYLIAASLYYSDDQGVNWTTGAAGVFGGFLDAVYTPYGLVVLTSNGQVVSHDQGINFHTIAVDYDGITQASYDPLHKALIGVESGGTYVRLFYLADNALPGQEIGHWVYTSTGAQTWTAPWSGWFEFDVIGAGGSGGGADANATASVAGASGGGAGSHAIFRKWCDEGEIVYLAVGAKGAAPSAGNNDGNDGGDTKIGSTNGGSEYVLCQGGRKGLKAQAGATAITLAALAANSTNTFGSAIPTSDRILDEQGQGSWNQTLLQNFGIGGYAAFTASYGGRSPVGPAPRMAIVQGAGQVIAGTAGVGPGAGGGGATVRESNTDAAGAAGNDGQIIIRAAA